MNMFRKRIRLYLAASLVMTIMGCGGSGSESINGETDPGDGSYIRMGSISTTPEDCSLPSTKCTLSVKYGDVFDEDVIDIQTTYYGLPITLPGGAVGVDVTWESLTTGDTGEAQVRWSCDRFWRLCNADWEAVNIPLEMGHNTIIFTATGVSGRVATLKYTHSRILGAPEKFKADIQWDRATLTWEEMPGAESYNLYYQKKAGLYSPTSRYANPPPIKITGITSPYVLSNLDIGGFYHFAVVAVINEAEGKYSQTRGEMGWSFFDLVDNGIDAEISLDSLDYVHIHNQSFTGPGKYWTNSSGSWTYLDIDTYPDGNAALELDANNVPHVIFVEDADLKYAYLDSGIWVTSTIESGRIYRDPHLAIDMNGKAHTSYYADTKVMYANNELGSWNTLLLNGEYPDIKGHRQCETGCLMTAIKLDDASNVHIAYVTIGSYPDWKVRYVTNRSGQWVEELIDPNSPPIENVAMEIDISGNVHLLYDSYYATNKSGEWKLDIIDTATGIGWYHGFPGESYSMDIDLQGFLHLAYRISGEILGYANNTNGEWQDHIIQFEDNAPSYNTEGLCAYICNRVGAYTIDLAVDSLNQVHIVYTDIVGGTSRYITNRSP